jgi:hypothetical protein
MEEPAVTGQVVSFPGAQHRHSGERPNQHARTPEAAELRAKQRRIRNLNKCLRLARKAGLKVRVHFPEFIPPALPQLQCTDSLRPWPRAY